MNNFEFYLPDKDTNAITKGDCQKGVLRITRESKSFFPKLEDGESEWIIFIINGKEFTIEYKMREPRSSLLRLQKRGFQEACIYPGSTVKITILEKNKKYKLEAI